MFNWTANKECFNSSKFIGKVTFKKFVVYIEKIKVKVYLNKEISITYKDTTRLWFFFAFSSWIINDFLKLF
jgi:hypothetical protein